MIENIKRAVPDWRNFVIGSLFVLIVLSLGVVPS